MNVNDIPVIAIDGPSASGKGTVAQRVAEQMGFHYLDSGSLYRLAGLKVLKLGQDLADAFAVTRIAANLDIAFRDGKTLLDGQDVSDEIRTEAASQNASKVAALPNPAR